MAVKQTYTPSTALQQQYQQFWQVFNKISASSEEFCREFTPHQYASIRSYQDYAIGRKYHISTGVDFSNCVVKVTAYFRDLAAYLEVYQQDKARIEEEMVQALRWRAFKTKGSITLFASVAIYRNGNWEEACKVMMENMIKMKNVVK